MAVGERASTRRLGGRAPRRGREAAQTRRQRREAQAADAQPQAGAESPTQGHVARRSRPRVHADLLTVPIRGHFAERMRALSETHGMSLGRLLKDALLVYERDVEAGYEPGASLRSWQEREGRTSDQA